MDSEKQITCPINGLPAKPYVVKGRAEYFIEPVSGLIFQKKLPSTEEMEAYVQTEYKGGVYRSYSKAAPLKQKTGLRRLQDIKAYGTPGALLLDVGCATGIFIEVARENGFDAHGVELSSEARALAKPEIRDCITTADVNTHVRSSGRHYDVITAYDIIEHTQDPRRFLRDLYDALGPGGVVAIAAPDTGHFLRYVMGEAWPMLQPWQHTFLFSKRGLKELMVEVGFQDVIVKPTRKILTPRYLADQLVETNPGLGRVLTTMMSIGPSFLADLAIAINISEMFALGRKPVG